MKKEQIKGSVMLLFATLIWGSAFVAQSVGMDHLGPMTFQAIRSILAVLALLPVTALMDRSPGAFLPRWKTKGLWKTGILCGLALFVAQSLQQVGLLALHKSYSFLAVGQGGVICGGGKALTDGADAIDVLGRVLAVHIRKGIGAGSRRH